MKLLTLSILFLSALVATELTADVSRKNMREIQRDNFYYRVDKTFNVAFCRRHFDSDKDQYELLNYLIDTAELFDVAPEGIFGSIMAEHSMNQRSQFKQKGELGMNLIGRNFGRKGEDLVNQLNVYFRGSDGAASFGPGQIQPAIAEAMQPRVKEMRKDASEEELSKYTWKGAINLIAAYMDYACEAYEEAGFVGDDSPRKNPYVLCTLMNIGEKNLSFYDRAVETRELIDQGEREDLWMNYFGYWVYRNKHIITKKIEKAKKVAS
jgi:hypothetical protein